MENGARISLMISTSGTRDPGVGNKLPGCRESSSLGFHESHPFENEGHCQEDLELESNCFIERCVLAITGRGYLKHPILI